MLQRRVPLAPLVTFGLGGRADYFFEVRRPEELVAAYCLARKANAPVTLLAGGSNVVPPDGLLIGLTIRYQTPRGGIMGDSGRVVCEAGVGLGRFINWTIKRGLAGLEALSGIPGTVGGAVVGNAGAYGQCISDQLVAVEIFDGIKTRWLTKTDVQFAYRESVFKQQPGWLVLRAEFGLKSGDQKSLAKKSREIIKTRLTRYPTGLKCPGSFFKNVFARDVGPLALAKIDSSKIIDGKIPAGYLLQTVGACGLRRGQLAVASYHGNLIINRARARAREVKALAAELKKRVRQRFGIELEEEVRYLDKFVFL